MNVLAWPSVTGAFFCQSPILRRSLATFTDGAYVRIDVNRGNLALKTSADAPCADIAAQQSTVAHIDHQPGKMRSLTLLDPTTEALPPLAEDRRGGRWVAYACTFENDAVDHLYLRVRGNGTPEQIVGIIQAIWPVLREDCLKEAASPEAEAAAGALLWTISNKTDEAVIVLNAAGQVLHVNSAGKTMLEAGQLLTETPTGLACSTSRQTGAFHKAIRTCLMEAQGSKTDFIMFLEAADGAGKVPVSLSRYQAARSAMPLVVAIVPQQPDLARIEMLAQKMGLTPSEARVAALMQMGLPNRQAAQIAGLKEQTFSTYSKRVLAKLNVGCRAEMAHMLTWQSSVGRVS